jgi:nanoRNase/pAp phosphatase (c-di-AMP/oligoRNAs hydrolase)
MASGFALKYLIEKFFNIEAMIVHGGHVGRAENRAMIRELKIPLKNIHHIQFKSTDCVLLVDTHPGSLNNSLPPDVHCNIYIDHHPGRPGKNVELACIDTEVGTTATLLIEWLVESRLDITPSLATALAYAIRSETQDLGRETSSRDIQAYLTVYPKTSMRKLSRIQYPKLPRIYFSTLARTLHCTMTFHNIIWAHIGDVNVPEIVAEMADMLLRHQRMSWSFCSGRFGGNIYISLRSSNPKAKAWRVIQQLVEDPNDAGGHETFAGGRIRINTLTSDEVKIREDRLVYDFMRILGYKEGDGKPLLDE